MEKKDRIIQVYSSDKVTVYHLKKELAEQGIESMVKSNYESGLIAGVVSGSQSTYELFVLEKDFENAHLIIEKLI